MRLIWEKVTEVDRVICQQFREMADMFEDQQPMRSIDNHRDEMPRNRNKLLHQQGIVAKAEFIPVENPIYKGIFESGAQNVIIRMSESNLITNDSPSANPSIAFKFLRDG